MRLIVTGAAGFIGSNIVEAAKKHWDGEIVAVANYHSDGKSGWCPAGVRVERIDIRDTDALVALKPSRLINAAALVSVPYSYTLPSAYWDTNATAVQRMVARLGAAGCRVTQISTSEIFDGAHPPYKADAAPCAITPYGASKAAAEAITRACGGQVVRLFNNFGPKQMPRAVIPRMIQMAFQVKRMQRDTADLYGPVGSRAFLFAPWVAEQIVKKVIWDERPLVQLASNQVIALKWLWAAIAGMVGIPADRVVWNPPPANASPVACLYGFSSQGYDTPAFDLDALRATVEWFAKTPPYYSMETYE